ncbi:hypothetical protein F7725_001454 [Dissostichus mawsoni]|uniref:Uncharacterized protein n=1 Tax=Dissostichus mawsoni TaxID=36200 RepID=A0A7J5ZJR8_DISMA|nr:hypothetical protein F7725_001454 [Dissostichus mawsoni]
MDSGDGADGKFCPEVTLTYAVRGNRKERGVRLQQQVVIWTLWYINIYNISVAPQRRGACACSSTWSSGPSGRRGACACSSTWSSGPSGEGRAPAVARGHQDPQRRGACACSSTWSSGPSGVLIYIISLCRPPVERGVRLQQHVVIGTPGTLLDWCSKYRIIDPKLISMFVLDEADVMIATQGHRDQSIRIHRLLPKECQMLLFSATFEDSVWGFAEKREEETLDTIKQFYILCREEEEKFSALCDLYGGLTVAQAMIFCRRFRTGKEKVLVTTNVCSRGIDVEQVTLVVNFDLPVDMEGNADNETYLHRIGRTGHRSISRLDPGNLQEMELLIS